MARSTTTAPVEGSALLGALVALLVRELAPAVAAELAKHQAAPLPRWATAKQNPCGSARAFREAVRSGRFEVVKLGRTPAISWADAETWIAEQAKPAAPTTTAPASVAAMPDAGQRRTLLEAAGVRFQGGAPPASLSRRKAA